MTAVAPSADIVAPLPVRRSIPWYRRLYTLVLASIVLGALLGYFFPDFAQLCHLARSVPWRSPSVVGLVVPTGYSFNLDGTSIYSQWRPCS
jgi:Na+/H+-dicarboxylate symporter